MKRFYLKQAASGQWVIDVVFPGTAEDYDLAHPNRRNTRLGTYPDYSTAKEAFKKLAQKEK